MSLVSGSSRSKWKFLVMMLLTSAFVGWYVNTRGMVGLASGTSERSEMMASQGIADTCSCAR